MKEQYPELNQNQCAYRIFATTLLHSQFGSRAADFVSFVLPLHIGAMTFDPAWTSDELAKELCDKLVASGQLKENCS